MMVQLVVVFCYLLDSLIHLVLFIWNCLARVCLFRTVFVVL